jgi:integrase
MVCALGTPKRHPESGIYQFRKRVPERLRESVGKNEIKFSLHTRDPDVARLRNLEAMIQFERQWSGVDLVALDAGGRPLLHLQCKSVTSTPPAAAEHETSEPITDLPLLTSAATKSEGVVMTLLFKAYADEGQLAPSTVKRWSPVIGQLVAHLGHDDPGRVTRMDIVEWKNALLKAGKSNITVRDVYLAAAKATLQYAADQGILADNPAVGVKVRVKAATHEREKGFDESEAKTILAAALVPPSQKISVEMAAARRWIPWISAYSGARVNEITCLAGRDIIMVDGIAMMRVRAETNKTRKSRLVPLHSHLIEQGFLAYAKSRGTRPLFYDPARSRGGSDANPHFKKVGERIAEWVRSLGIDVRVAPNHGWRHRFTSVARFVAMPEDVRHFIQGHAGAKVADRYGDTWPQVSQREIEKLPRYLLGSEELPATEHAQLLARPDDAH